MNKTTSTPGPWSVESDGTTVAMRNQCVITMPGPDGAPRDEFKANARLIAAAPALLEALRAMIVNADDGKVFSSSFGINPVLVMARAALAKAAA